MARKTGENAPKWMKIIRKGAIKTQNAAFLERVLEILGRLLRQKTRRKIVNR